MTAFVALTPELVIPFSLKIFHYFFIPRVMKFEGWFTIGARHNKKLIKGALQKFSGWYNRFFFIFVFEDLPLLSKWADVNRPLQGTMSSL